MFYPGCTQTKEEEAKWWRRHPITLPTMPEPPLNDNSSDLNELREGLLRLEQRTPASNQEVYQLKHLVNKLMERVNKLDKGVKKIEGTGFYV